MSANNPRADGGDGASPGHAQFRRDLICAAVTGLLANPATQGSSTGIVPDIAFMSALIADRVIAEEAGKQS